MPIKGLDEVRKHLHPSATVNSIQRKSGLKGTVVQDALRRLGYTWTLGKKPIRKRVTS